MAKDYYKILGVNKEASNDEIKRAYRKLALKYHPDKTKNDKDSEQRFKEVNEAYQVLSNSAKRQQYDQFGQTFSGATGGSGFSGFRPEDFSKFTQDFSDLGGFGDIFESFFSGGSKSRRHNPEARLRGKDIEVNLDISFKEAAFGITKNISIARYITCETCVGTGAADKNLITCDKCNGTGQIRVSRRTILGIMTQVHVCDVCRGLGKKPAKICRNCRGEGRKNITETVTVKIPPGIDNGQTIKIDSMGEAGIRGNKSGDLYIVIHVLESPDFKRQGADLYKENYINYPTAVLGGTIKIKTLEKDVNLKIPAGTKSGDIFRLKGKGLARIGRSGHGDMYIKVNIEVLQKTTLKQKRLLEELGQELE